MPSSSLSPPKAQKPWNSRSQRRQTNLKKAASSPSQTSITDYYKFIDEFESQLFHFKTLNASLQLSLNAMEERL